MTLLDYPKCPVCFKTVSLKQLWRIARTSRGGLLIGRIGIACPSCGAKLRVVQTLSIVCAVAPYALVIAGALYFGDAPRTNRLRNFSDFDVVVLMGVLLLLPYWLIPRLARLRVLQSGETVEFPLEKVSKEALATIDESDIDADSSNITPEGSAWICNRCGEENPGTFEICWKCQTAKPNQSS